MFAVVAVVALLLGVARLSLHESWAATAAAACALAGPPMILLARRSTRARATCRAFLVGLALLSPLLLAGPSAWMAAALTSPCNPCPPHFCADVAPPASGSSPFLPAVAALGVSLLATAVAPWLGKRVAGRADGALSVLAPGAFSAAVAALAVGTIVLQSRPASKDYWEQLPSAGVATEVAPLELLAGTAIAVSMAPYHGRKLSARLASAPPRVMRLYDTEARSVTVRVDTPRRELLCPPRPANVPRSLDSLECTPLTADQLGSAVRPAAAWALAGVAGLLSAGIALALRVRWSRQLRGTVEGSRTVYRGEVDVEIDAQSRLRNLIRLANAHAVVASVLVLSSPAWRLVLFR